MENWREYLQENVPQRGPSGNAGFVGEPEDTIQMTVRELLDQTYDIAYVKDVAEIDADPQHPDRTWAVFEKVKEYQEYFERNPNLEQLPPFQVKGSWLTDGAHRFNALRLATKNRPELLDQIIRVNVYSTKPHWQQHPGDGHWSKQIFENWRMFLEERTRCVTVEELRQSIIAENEGEDYVPKNELKHILRKWENAEYDSDEHRWQEYAADIQDLLAEPSSLGVSEEDPMRSGSPTSPLRRPELEEGKPDLSQKKATKEWGKKNRKGESPKFRRSSKKEMGEKTKEQRGKQGLKET